MIKKGKKIKFYYKKGKTMTKFYLKKGEKEK